MVLDPSGDFFSEQTFRNLLPALGPFLLALIVSMAVTPLLIGAARRTGFLARPRSRDIHRKPTPYLGGVALYIGFATAALAFFRDDSQLGGLLVMGGLATGVFLVDDRWGLPARVKFAVQLALTVLAVAGFGFRVEYLYLGPLQLPELGIMAYPVTVIWLMSVMNVINFLDGLDGLASGVVGVTALVLLIAAAGRQPDVVALSAALMGACAGFLVFNFHPARIFMGDAGAHFLGLMVGLLSVVGVAKVAVGFAVLTPCLAMGLPILDTALAIVRRRRRGLSIAHADDGHMHHRVLRFGFSQRETCFLFYGGSAILGAVGLTVFGHRRILATVAVVTFVILSTMVGARLQAMGYRVRLPSGWALRRAVSPDQVEHRRDDGRGAA